MAYYNSSHVCCRSRYWKLSGIYLSLSPQKGSFVFVHSYLSCNGICCFTFGPFLIETVLVKKLQFRPTWYLRFISLNTYVAFTMFIAVTFPFFGGLLGFFGGFAFSPTILSPLHHVASNLQATEVLPVLVSQLDMHHVGVLLMILSPTGGLRSIILEAKDYKFYS